VAVVRKSELARLVGASPASITNAHWSGKIRVNEAGRIDLDDPHNLDFMLRERAKRPGLRLPPIPGTAPAPDSGVGEPVPRDRESEKADVDVAIKRVKLARERSHYMEQIGRAVPLELVQRAFGELNAALEGYFKSFAEGVVDIVVDMVQAGKGRSEITETLQDRIDKGFQASKEVAKAQIEALRK